MSEACSASEDPWANWSDEALLEYEERLYDDELAGDDTWFLRDQVLWEINRRNRWAKK